MGTEIRRTERPAQHLTNPNDEENGERLTLCGRRFDSLPDGVYVWDYRDGFGVATFAPFCEDCKGVVERAELSGADDLTTYAPSAARIGDYRKATDALEDPQPTGARRFYGEADRDAFHETIAADVDASADPAPLQIQIRTYETDNGFGFELTDNAGWHSNDDGYMTREEANEAATASALRIMKRDRTPESPTLRPGYSADDLAEIFSQGAEDERERAEDRNAARVYGLEDRTPDIGPDTAPDVLRAFLEALRAGQVPQVADVAEAEADVLRWITNAEHRDALHARALAPETLQAIQDAREGLLDLLDVIYADNGYGDAYGVVYASANSLSALVDRERGLIERAGKDGK